MNSKPTITLMVGPPGSGKTKWTLDHIIDDLYVRINQDEQGKKEHLDIFNQALADKKDIFIDRMNFNVGQRRRYIDPARKAGYHVCIVVHHASRALCLERCANRLSHPTIKNGEDAEKAITYFFRNYQRVEDEEADEVYRLGWENQNINAIVSDLDGTLANVDHRLHYVRAEKPNKPNWKAFFENMVLDSVNNWCKSLLSLMSEDYLIVYATGRPADYLKETEDWLGENGLKFPGYQLFMRMKKDNRKDDTIKEIILEFEIKTRYNILFIVDDRPSVCRMWRKHKYTVLQCQDKEF